MGVYRKRIAVPLMSAGSATRGFIGDGGGAGRLADLAYRTVAGAVKRVEEWKPGITRNQLSVIPVHLPSLDRGHVPSRLHNTQPYLLL
jgi:hypothetical protein